MLGFDYATFDREKIIKEKILMLENFLGKYNISYPYQKDDYIGFMIYKGDKEYSVVIGSSFHGEFSYKHPLMEIKIKNNVFRGTNLLEIIEFIEQEEKEK